MRSNVLLSFFFAMTFLILSAPLASAGSKDPVISETDRARVEQLTSRLNQIKAMDIKSMSKSEKKALRKEVKEIKREVNAISGGVYLSIGAIIIIVLLLILLL